MAVKQIVQKLNCLTKLRQRSTDTLIQRHTRCVRVLQTSSTNKNPSEPIGIRSTSEALKDTFNRHHDYLRISVTERCNLRCLYCMPKDGVSLSPSSHLLTTREIIYLSRLFVSQGVKKIRLTGGEPTIRKDFLQLVHALGRLRSEGLHEIAITTNGIALSRKLDEMAQAGLTGVNLSLDTLDPLQYPIMTRRSGFEAVMKTLNRIMELKRSGVNMRLKINCVVMHGINEDQIIPFVELGKDMDLEVRFIEYMPFSGNRWSKQKMVAFEEMLNIIRSRYPGIYRLKDHPNDTSKSYKVPGFTGKVGFITSMTQSFCGSCNRLRITSDGNLKVCLFGNAEISLRDIIRKYNSGQPHETPFDTMQKESNTWQQDLLPLQSSLKDDKMERELLKVIGLAVKRKREKHAGLGILEHLQNRPMILIDQCQNIISPAGSNITPKTPILASNPKFDSRIPLYSTKRIMLPGMPQTKTFFRSKSSLACNKHSKPTKANNKVQDKSLSNKLDSFPFSSDDKNQHESTRTPPNDHHHCDNEHSSTKFPHLTSSGTAHMIPTTHKPFTARTAVATCTVNFSNPLIPKLIAVNQIRKGDVLSVARIAGIMAAKRTAELLPLCHPIPLSHVEVTAEILDPEVSERKDDDDNHHHHHEEEEESNDTFENRRIKPNDKNPSVSITAAVECIAQTGVEMEALCAANVAALTVYDMCKALDKEIVLGNCRVIEKRGGRSGDWKVEEGQLKRVIKTYERTNER